MSTPVVVEHRGVMVVRDDLYPGGTKARYIAAVFDGADVVVYASPCEGGAQVALAHVAKQLGKRVVIVCAQRRVRHRRTVQAADLGAELVEIDGMAMFGVVSSRARRFAHEHGYRLAPFGLDVPAAVPAIRDAAIATGMAPDEVWCAASSGVLARGLAAAFPAARRVVVRVGHRVTPASVNHARILSYGPYLRSAVPCADFPADPHYEGKAWALCQQHKGPGVVLFWNVTDNGAP